MASLVKANMYKNVLALRQVSWRALCNSARREVSNKVPAKQKMFQENNGIPVHLKGGVGDSMLYRTTIALTVGGTAFAVYELLKAAFPQKNE